jgi:hypothetical protein
MVRVWMNYENNYLQTLTHALRDTDVTSIGFAQMSNKLSNLIIIMNNNLFNLNNKVNISYGIYQIFFYQ